MKASEHLGWRRDTMTAEGLSRRDHLGIQRRGVAEDVVDHRYGSGRDGRQQLQLEFSVGMLDAVRYLENHFCARCNGTSPSRATRTIRRRAAPKSSRA